MSEPRPVYDEGKVHVQGEQCSTCVFRPGNLMHLPEGRLKRLVDENLETGGAITCHQTLPYYKEPVEQQAVCRGFFDGYKERTPSLILAEALDIIEEV